jgi:nucleoside-diphosphate-sugar epimerase
MILNELSGYPNMRMNCVDVKDCSRAHLRALERPEAANKRFILSMVDDLPMVELAN